MLLERALPYHQSRPGGGRSGSGSQQIENGDDAKGMASLGNTMLLSFLSTTTHRGFLYGHSHTGGKHCATGYLSLKW